MKYVTAFGRFWWDFVVGDDAVLAIGVVLGLAVTGFLVAAGLDGWWFLPVAAAGTLAVSLRRAVHRR